MDRGLSTAARKVSTGDLSGAATSPNKRSGEIYLDILYVLLWGSTLGICEHAQFQDIIQEEMVGTFSGSALLRTVKHTFRRLK